MKKLRVAIIGQGRSGYSIHGHYFAGDNNDVVEVVAVADKLPVRRKMAKERHGCDVYEDFHEFYKRDDIDLVVNSTYSMDHAAITRELLEHGFNVLVEKPFCRTEAEGEELIALAKEKGVTLAVFQQSLFAPNFRKVKEIIEEGKLGEIVQIDINYCNYARRWDWQTLQSFMGGSIYNTGPHPIGHALDFLDWDPEVKVVYSRLLTAITSGDAEDYAKILMTAPGKPLVQVNIMTTDAYGEPAFKVQGTKGTLIQKGNSWEMKYVIQEELEPRPVIKESLMDAEGTPLYCGETLIWHEEQGEITGSSFDVGTDMFYHMMADTILEGKPLVIVPEYAARVVGIIDTCHKMNPLPVKF